MGFTIASDAKRQAAQAVKDASKRLNETAEAAARLGLLVDFGTMDVTEHGAMRRVILSVKILDPL